MRTYLCKGLLLFLVLLLCFSFFFLFFFFLLILSSTMTGRYSHEAANEAGLWNIVRCSARAVRPGRWTVCSRLYRRTNLRLVQRIVHRETMNHVRLESSHPGTKTNYTSNRPSKTRCRLLWVCSKNERLNPLLFSPPNIEFAGVHARKKFTFEILRKTFRHGA